MEVTHVLKIKSRGEWRNWLITHHDSAVDIWIAIDKCIENDAVSYLDTVEESICFGWIDGIAKKTEGNITVQRFTPRKNKSHWTELNKARARRLIKLGLMTYAGFATLPNLDEQFVIPDDLVKIFKEDEEIWQNFQQFPELYKRVRVSYIDEVRKLPEEFDRRLKNFLNKTKANVMFGNWNDGGKLE